MSSGPTVDGVLVQWGERLFYPSNRIVKPAPTPRLNTLTRRKAAVIRRRIEATATWRAPQVMVKVTGGGRDMKAIAAHFRYISKNGRLAIEDDRGVVRDGKEALHDLAEQWRYGGSLIGDVGHRREAFNIMLSMPHGTDPRLVQKAAREFAQAEMSEHRYVMVLHEHQANPHVNLSVRAESRTGERLNPRKTDLHRWRETFAEKLRGCGVEAEATRQATRGGNRNFDPLWRVKARQDGRLRQTGAATKAGQRYWDSRADAMRGWAHIMKALAASESPEARKLAEHVSRFVRGAPFVREAVRQR
ncbi:relaxase/mobilization nuclease domain-containing protein [Aquabacterium humicola]|uniref:relaxase/mobilization nuclease domain-containing protein n=1 Tax=Aquabacterium humicola TaxID=3237377 RepID=UPI0025428931|nr:conjugal transfer protein TraS [Rubrivivax pictus]